MGFVFFQYNLKEPEPQPWQTPNISQRTKRVSNIGSCLQFLLSLVKYFLSCGTLIHIWFEKL